ncbi:UDP-N-acetylglucosamine transferase subunit ALG13 [Motilibacter peucedani]|uniref:UDP-N-acetylglucosamine transferase subunit ALG13 n=1 Tax=Motilibacter peucedani TaxID=598650 RepID=A0A420XLB6_9ACTN|nr:glycosyltransferase [Motilibacter peucedani]RKS71324.1 UDP-N-acetylglucosamine transferase subunit ALG13 [Motilibacter peucedani]
MIVLPDTDAARLPLVFVTVGSDYHPFSRLISWVDGWMADGGSQRARCIMQYGTAPAPAHAEGEAFMGHDLVLSLMRSSTAIVAQGGPMTLIESRRQGRLPIAVPRTASLGEVVDDHQHAFCAHLHAQGHAVLATDEESVRRLLDEAVAAPAKFRVDVTAEGQQVDEAVERFASIAQRLLDERRASAQVPRRRLPLTRLRRSGVGARS